MKLTQDSDHTISHRVVDLTIVVPCLNEEKNIENILDEVGNFAKSQDFSTEIVIVDDKSDDQTEQVALEWIKRNGKSVPTKLVVRDLHRRGYGAVVRYGAAHGTGRYCIFVSADAVDPVSLISALYEKMENGAILAQCSRYIAEGDASTIPFKYRFFQFFFRIGVWISLGQKIPDSTYSFKMFRRREMLGMGLSQNRFSISPEITFKSILTGGRIDYVPGAQGTRKHGTSKFIFHKEGIGFGYCLLRAFLHHYKIMYWF